MSATQQHNADANAASRFFSGTADAVAEGYNAIPTWVKAGVVVGGCVSAGVLLERSGYAAAALEKVGSLFTRAGEAISS